MQNFSKLQFISTIQADRYEQKHKILGADQYRIGKFIKIQTTSYLQKLNIQLLRQNTKLTKSIDYFQRSYTISTIDDEKKDSSQQLIFTNAPFSKCSNILRFLNLPSRNKRQLQNEQKAILINKTIVKLIIALMKQTNYQIYAFQDISIQVNEQDLEVEISIDESAMTGIDMLMYGQEISQIQFYKIYEILLTSTLNEKVRNSTIFSFQLKVRSIAKILINLISQRNWSFKSIMTKQITRKDTTKKLSKAECQKMMKERKNYVEKLFQSQAFIQKIENVQKQVNNLFSQQLVKKVDYKNFLKKVFLEQKQLNWTQVIQLLVPTVTSNSKKLNFGENFIGYQKILQYFQEKQSLEFRQKLNLLGLNQQPKPLFIALMSEYSKYAQQAIQYQDLNQVFYGPNYLPLDTKNELFSFLLLLLGQALLQNQPMISLIQEYQLLQELKEKFRIQCAINNFQQQKQYLYSQLPDKLLPQYPNFKAKKQNKNNSQLGPCFQRIFQNFGILQMKIKTKPFFSQNHYTLGLKKFQKRFK